MVRGSRPASLVADASTSTIVASLVILVVSWGGPAAILFQAAEAGALTPGQLDTWIWSLGVGIGVCGIGLSWWFKTPVICAWSSPGSALLIAGFVDYPYAEVLGAYVVAAVIMLVVAVSGWLDRLLDLLPEAVVGALLAGILLRFALAVFGNFVISPGLVAPMLIAFVLAKRFGPRWAVVAVLLVGVVAALIDGRIDGADISFAAASPLFTMPAFDLAAIAGLGLPLFLVTLSGQNATGMAVLRGCGYREIAAAPIVGVTALVWLLLAPFGAHGINLAAITAAIGAGPESHPDPDRRYVAGIATGLGYIAVGVLGATLVSLFSAIPSELVAVIAGVALLSPIRAGLGTAMADESTSEAGLITFVVTASGVSWLGVSAPFWGLVAGSVYHLVTRRAA